MKFLQRFIDFLFNKTSQTTPTQKIVSNNTPHQVVFVNPFSQADLDKPVEPISTDSLLKLPYSSIQLFNEFVKQHRSLVFRFMMIKIRTAIREKQPYINFFRMGDTARIARMNRNEFSKSLNEMIMWFSEKEEYEFAAEARDILKEFEVSNVIDNK